MSAGLVLRRSIGEILTIGPDIEVMVVDIEAVPPKGTPPFMNWERLNAKIGVKAPRHIEVHRKEYSDKLARARLITAAAMPVPALLPGEGPVKINDVAYVPERLLTAALAELAALRAGLLVDGMQRRRVACIEHDLATQ